LAALSGRGGQRVELTLTGRARGPRFVPGVPATLLHEMGPLLHLEPRECPPLSVARGLVPPDEPFVAAVEHLGPRLKAIVGEPTRRNDVYAMRMSLPTQNFTLICNAPSDVRLIPTSFDTTPPEESTEALGHVVIAINEWLLPGHGVCLAWDLPSRRGIRAEQRDGGQEVGIARDIASTPQPEKTAETQG
jgi:hypothetical protein